MQITQEHERWFRDVGQFIQPAGDLDSNKSLNYLLRYSQGVRDSLEQISEQRLEDEFAAGANEAKEEAEVEMNRLKERILEIVRENDGEKLETKALKKEIQKLCEA